MTTLLGIGSVALPGVELSETGLGLVGEVDDFFFFAAVAVDFLVAAAGPFFAVVFFCLLEVISLDFAIIVMLMLS